jgi:ABC-type transporter Mla MlaB component
MITPPPVSQCNEAPHNTPCLTRPDGFWSLPSCSVALLNTEHGERLVVAGMLEAASLPAFSAQIDQLMCTPCGAVHLDLSGVTSIDEAGANAVTGLQSYIEGRGGTLLVTWPDTPSDQDECGNDEPTASFVRAPTPNLVQVASPQ